MVCLKNFMIALTAAVLAACGGTDEPPERDAVPIIAQTVLMLPEGEQIEAVGSARAATSAQIFPDTAGQVRRVRFAAGDYVRQGDVLVELDARRERLAVELAQVQVREADQLLGRYRRIEDTGAISDSQIEAGETALASARVALRQAQTALADRTIRAPFSGHIGLTEIDVGDRIDPSTPIAQLDQRATLYVDFPAPETVFDRLREGTIVTISPFSAPDRQIEARVIATDSTISPDQRNFIVRTAVNNSGDRLRPGMSFRVVLSGKGVTRPAIPEEAIVWGGEGAYLWAVRDGKARRVPLTITSRRDGRAFVDAPLSAKDTIVVEGVQKVRDGQDVRIVKPAPAAVQTGTLTPAPASRAQP